MLKNTSSQSGFFNPRVILVFTLCSAGALLAMFSFAATSSPDGNVNVTASSMQLAPAAGSWSIVASPNTSTTQNNDLWAVACASAQDCWAVGTYFDGAYYHTLTEHWDGNAWKIVPSPNTSETQLNVLFAVTCVSSSDCWAVGYGSANLLSLTLHWNGNAWSIVPSSNASGVQNILTGVACTSSSDCWAVGYYSAGPNELGIYQYPSLVEHWNGSQWSIVSSQNTSASQNILYGVTCTSSSSCWSVGYSTGNTPVGPFRTFIQQWNGVSWKIVPSPSTSEANNNFLFNVSCVSASNCRAAGYSNTPNAGNAQTLIEHWNGTAWTIEPTPNVDLVGNNAFFGVACASGANCWAAGYYNGANAIQTLVERWDGNSWTVSQSPNTSATQQNVLNFVTCTSAYDCWAVGYYNNSSGVSQTLIERYNVPPVQLFRVVSRKTHGQAGPFDIVVISPGLESPEFRGVECRSGGVSGNHTLIFTFTNTLTSVGGASVSKGIGSVSSSNIGSSDRHNYIVNLTGVTNAQVITVSLSNVTDSAGNSSSAVEAPMEILLGDTTSDRAVNSSDISQTKSKSGQVVTSVNFRQDVTVNSSINSSDISLVKSKSGTALP
jgi:hypothetical protein